MYSREKACHTGGNLLEDLPTDDIAFSMGRSGLSSGPVPPLRDRWSDDQCSEIAPLPILDAPFLPTSSEPRGGWEIREAERRGR